MSYSKDQEEWEMEATSHPAWKDFKAYADREIGYLDWCELKGFWECYLAGWWKGKIMAEKEITEEIAANTPTHEDLEKYSSPPPQSWFEEKWEK